MTTNPIGNLSSLSLHCPGDFCRSLLGNRRDHRKSRSFIYSRPNLHTNQVQKNPQSHKRGTESVAGIDKCPNHSLLHNFLMSTYPISRIISFTHIAHHKSAPEESIQSSFSRVLWKTIKVQSINPHIIQKDRKMKLTFRTISFTSTFVVCFNFE